MTELPPVAERTTPFEQPFVWSSAPDDACACRALAGHLWLFPAEEHYWDGIGFALNIEGIGEDGQGVVRNHGHVTSVASVYFNPNY